MRKIVLVIHNVRSSHNVGALLRTADGLGIEKVILSGYTPYPIAKEDERLPHLALKTHKQIHKTALGAEDTVRWKQTEHLANELKSLRDNGYRVYALEQTAEALDLNGAKPPPKIALIVGNEISGLDSEILDAADQHLFIPMRGGKESFNVAAAGAMALYYLINV